MNRPVQQRVLGLLFGQPERRFQSAELIRLVKGGTGAVHRQLGRLTVAGLVDVMAALAPRIHAAFVYGSVAKGTDRGSSDIDLMVVSDSVRYADVFDAAQTAEAVLGRKVNPIVMTVAQWRAKRTRGDSFVARVAAQPRILVIGSGDDLG